MNHVSITKEKLSVLYTKQKLSSKQIAVQLGCSTGKINYWLAKYGIPKRNISDAVYERSNPSGDPFKVKNFQIERKSFLLGLGLGLYWGEGTKANQHAVRLGNSDPSLVRAFVHFLSTLYGVDKTKIKYGIQIFNDLNKNKIELFWVRELKCKRSQFYKTIVTQSTKKGNYSNKTKYGVVTVYFLNVKLRNILIQEVEQLRKLY